jgi:dihydrofolate reductase
MATLQYQCTMSLDGFIAGPGGDMSWLGESWSAEEVRHDPPVDELASQVGALLVGNRTFGGDDPNRGTEQEGAYGGIWHGPQFVLTHHPPDTPVTGVTFVTDLHRAVAAARDAAGDKLVAVLGADVARQCLAAGLLDEILVYIAPVLLGDGVRLFHHPGGERVRLTYQDVRPAPGTTSLRLRVVR